MCSYKSLLPQPCSQYSQTERRTRQECAATSPYCLSPVVSTKRQREELDRNVQLQVLIASVLHSVIKIREKNQIGMCSYKSLLPQSCSQYSQMESRTRQECATTSLIALVLQSLLRDREKNQIECADTSPYCLSPRVLRWREELDRNVQLQVLIASALQSVLRDREKNQIGMCSYKSLLPQPCSQYSRQREELDRNVQLQVLIASVLQSVLTDREKNQIGMCSYKSLLPQPCSQYSQTERRTRQECAATSPYCLSPVVSTKRQREELDRNVQLQVLIASVLQSVLTDGEKNSQECAATSPYCLSPAVSTHRQKKNQIGMCSYKSLLPQPCSQYSQTERRTRQECAATSPYCLSSAVSTQRQREELDRNVQLQVLIASVLQSVLRDREKNQIGMCSYKSLLPQSCSQYSQTERRTRQECAATSPYCLSSAVGTHRQELNQMGMCSYKSLLPQPCSHYSQTERRTRQECAATSPYCLSPAFSNQKQREELDRNVQL